MSIPDSSYVPLCQYQPSHSFCYANTGHRILTHRLEYLARDGRRVKESAGNGRKGCRSLLVRAPPPKSH
eukprot:3787568-Rhodomonas_salina.1